MNKKLSLIAICIASALGVAACGGSSGSSTPAPTPTPTPTPTPDPVQPPVVEEALAFVVTGSVVDADGLIVSGATLTFRESGELATGIVDASGESFSTLTAEDGSFTFTAAEDATLTFVSVTAEVDGYVRKVEEFDFTGVAEDTNILISLVAKPEAGAENATEAIAVEVEEAAVSEGTTAEEVVISASTAADENDTQVTTDVSVPASTQFQDANGEPVAGTSVSMEVQAVNPNTTDAGDIVPDGLSTVAGDESSIATPLAMTNIEMVDDLGNKIEQFSQPISITISVPDDGELAEGDEYDLSSYDETTGAWALESSKAMIGAQKDDGSFPATFETDHLTFFSISRTAPVCQDGITINVTSGEVPARGLAVSLTSSDGSIGSYLRGNSKQIVSGNATARYGISADATANVRIYDYSGNDWYNSNGEVAVCGDIDVTVENPVTTVDESLAVTATCSNDTTVSVDVPNGVMTYAKEGRAASLATSSSDGNYSLTGMDEGATYNVRINPRISIGGVVVTPQTTTITADGTDETFDISVQCETGTGAG